MKNETTPKRIDLTGAAIGTLSLQDLITLAMTKKKLPKGFGNQLKSLSTKLPDIQLTQVPPSPIKSTLHARCGPELK